MPNRDLPRVATNRCQLMAELVEGRDVLDIGCVEHDLENRKRGQWLHDHLRRTARSILGLDYEAAAVAALAAEGYNVIAGDATDFDLKRTFEMIVAGELIEHINNAGRFLECAGKHLKPGGEIVLTTPNANCLIYFLENLLLGEEIDNPDHVCIYTPRTIKLLLKRHGFEVTNVVFLAENTIYCHRSTGARILVAIKLAVQRVLALLQPSICHHMLIVARRTS